MSTHETDQASGEGSGQASGEELAHHIGGLQIALLLHEGADQACAQALREGLEALGAAITTLGPQRSLLAAASAAADDANLGPSLDQVVADELDALVLPGGGALHLAQALADNPAAQQLVRDMHAQGKPLGALGEAMALLLAAGVAPGRQLSGTSDWADRIAQAGGVWREDAVVVDGRLVTCAGLQSGDAAPAAIASFLAHFTQVLAERTRQSTGGTADDSASSAGMGG